MGVASANLSVCPGLIKSLVHWVSLSVPLPVWASSFSSIGSMIAWGGSANSSITSTKASSDGSPHEKTKARSPSSSLMMRATSSRSLIKTSVLPSSSCRTTTAPGPRRFTHYPAPCQIKENPRLFRPRENQPWLFPCSSTLLIDGDLPPRRVGAGFGISSQVGVSEVLIKRGR